MIAAMAARTAMKSPFVFGSGGDVRRLNGGFKQDRKKLFERLDHPPGRHTKRSAAFTTFVISATLVTGPTPPGTGVIAPATSTADS